MTHQRTSIIRTIGELRNLINEGRVAYYLGAGIDTQFSKDANIDSPPNWTNLVKSLYFLGQEKKEYEKLFDATTEEGRNWISFLENWTSEIATSVRWKIGDRQFSAKIKNFEDTNFSAEINNNQTLQLCKLLTKSNIIITTNYTKYIRKALEKFDSTKEYISLNREDLEGFVFPEPISPDLIKTIYIIHIHGQSSYESFPILDALGYNIAQFDDNNYTKILENIFLNRNVITIGSSWTDIPLRNVAGIINRKYPYLSRAHLGIYYLPKIPTPVLDSNPKITWMNSMNALYGVNIVCVDKEEQEKILIELNKSISFPNNHSNMEEVAEFLDSTGDYESQYQHQWFLELGRIDNNINDDEQSAVKNGVEIFSDAYNAFLHKDTSLNEGDWIIAGRIERHLRHHIYLYPPSGTNSKELRENIWNFLFDCYCKNNYSRKIKDEQLHFDFLTGLYEIRKKSDGFKLPLLKNDLLRKRLILSKDLWNDLPNFTGISDFTTELDGLEKLGIDLLELGWESMAAKVLADKVSYMAKGYCHFESKGEWGSRNTPVFSRLDILSEAKRVGEIAKVTGCIRRRIKSDILFALWNEDPRISRNRLLAQLQSNGNADSNMRLEAAMKNAIGIGLVFCHLRLAQQDINSKTNIFDEAKESLFTAGFKRPEKALSKGNINYWGQFIPKEIQKSVTSLVQMS